MRETDTLLVMQQDLVPNMRYEASSPASVAWC